MLVCLCAHSNLHDYDQWLPAVIPSKLGTPAIYLYEAILFKSFPFEHLYSSRANRVSLYIHTCDPEHAGRLSRGWEWPH